MKEMIAQALKRLFLYWEFGCRISSMVGAELIFDFFRSSSGLTLLIVGIGFMVAPDRTRALVASGSLLSSVGMAFLFSWSNQFGQIPLLLDNFILILIIYAISQSVFEIAIYLMGDEVHPGTRKRVYLAGASWLLFLWILPMLDLLLGLKPFQLSVEDGRQMALFQSIFFPALNIWPIAALVIAFKSGPWTLRDLSFKSRALKQLGLGILILIVLLFGMLISAGLNIQGAYHLSHVLIEVSLLTFALLLRMNPRIWDLARRDIKEEYEEHLTKELDNIKDIEDKVEAFSAFPNNFSNPDLSLAILASELHIPLYRLSHYFNHHRNVSFPAWLNDLRIRYAKKLLEERPDYSVLDIAMEVGYSSKSTFNTQFMRRGGQNPRDYRKNIPQNELI